MNKHSLLSYFSKCSLVNIFFASPIDSLLTYNLQKIEKKQQQNKTIMIQYFEGDQFIM